MNICPENFRCDEAPIRIIGTECENAVQGITRDGEMVYPSHWLSMAAVNAIGILREGDFLNNGGKLYWDGWSFEYAGPESMGPKEAAIQDHAGIGLVASVLEASEQPNGGIYRLSGSFKQVITADGEVKTIASSQGYHENFLVPLWILQEKRELTAGLMGSHLSTRLWAMNGTVNQDGFILSQKVSGIGQAVVDEYGEHSKHGSKPMAGFVTDDPTTAGATELWTRFETRFADPGLYLPTTELSLATSSLALRLAEHSHRFDAKRLQAMLLSDPVGAAKKFACDLTLRATTETREGRMVTAMDVQEQLANLALDLSKDVGLPDDEFEAIERWLGMIDVMRGIHPDRGEYTSQACMSINFAARHNYLLKKCDGVELTTASDEVVSRNLQWDRILPRGVGQEYWGRIAERKGENNEPYNPPVPHTRALSRARAITEISTSDPNQHTYVNWSKVTTQNGTLTLEDPYSYDSLHLAA